MKFYAVKNGRTPGIYRDWSSAEKQVKGFANAEYKSFSKITEATEYLDWNENTQKQILKPAQDDLARAISKIEHYKKTSGQNLVSRQTEHVADNYFATIYTDGGCRNTGNVSGGHVKARDKAAWAYLIEYGNQEVHDAGGQRGATNNKMEQQALIEALKKLMALGFNRKHLLFVLDSQYVLNAINKNWLLSWQKKGWRRANGSLANADRWQEMAKLLQNFPDSKFIWTKGHANNRGNEFVDHALNVFMDKM